MTTLKDLVGLIKLPEGEDSVSIVRKMRDSSESAAASTLGRKGGRSKSEAKVRAAKENGKKGGAPPKFRNVDVVSFNPDKPLGVIPVKRISKAELAKLYPKPDPSKS